MEEKTLEKIEQEQEPYALFAQIYDQIMDHVPYASWARYLLDRASGLCGARPQSVLDLACGTGMMLYFLKNSVRELIGMDYSSAMLQQTRRRLRAVKLIRGLLQPLPFRSGQFPWVICTHDSLNYILDKEELREHFREVRRILKPGGLYSVDAVTLGNILKNHHGQSDTHRIPPYRLVWSKRFDRKKNLLTSTLEFDDGDTSFQEVHVQRYYQAEELLTLARSAGLRLLVQEGNYDRRPTRSQDTLMNFHFSGT